VASVVAEFCPRALSVRVVDTRRKPRDRSAASAWASGIGGRTHGRTTTDVMREWCNPTCMYVCDGLHAVDRRSLTRARCVTGRLVPSPFPLFHRPRRCCRRSAAHPTLIRACRWRQTLREALIGPAVPPRRLTAVERVHLASTTQPAHVSPLQSGQFTRSIRAPTRVDGDETDACGHTQATDAK
jgi:hypothetical protein